MEQKALFFCLCLYWARNLDCSIESWYSIKVTKENCYRTGVVKPTYHRLLGYDTVVKGTFCWVLLLLTVLDKKCWTLFFLPFVVVITGKPQQQQLQGQCNKTSGIENRAKQLTRNHLYITPNSKTTCWWWKGVRTRKYNAGHDQQTELCSLLRNHRLPRVH